MRSGPRWKQRGRRGDEHMTAALRLVRDDGSDGELPPLVAWELFMRGAGRAERTIGDGLATMRRLEDDAGQPCDSSRGHVALT
jgi:integrase/recombinase XerD